MKKSLLFAIMIFFGLFSSVQAEVLKAKAVDEISTASPKDIISVTVSRDITLTDGTALKEGYVLTGKMLDVVAPDKWHQNASFTFIPISYTDTDGNTHEITNEIKATYRQKLKPDYEHSEISVGGLMFSPSYIDNTKKIIGGESKEVWEDYANRSTPWGKGVQIDIKPNETIYFNFPD